MTISNFLSSTPKLMYWLSMKLIVDSSVNDNEIHLQDLRLLGRIALFKVEVVVVFVFIYGIT